MTLRGALEWAGIVLFAAVGVLLLEWPLTRPWLIGTLMVLMLVPISRILYGLVVQERRFDLKCAESLTLPIGMICLLTHMWRDRPWLQLIGVLLILGSSVRAWHESRRVSDSSGPIAR